MLRIPYYVLLVLTSLFGVLYLVLPVIDHRPTRARNPRYEKGMIMLASVLMLALAAWAFRVGHQQGAWLRGIGFIVLAWVTWVVVFVVGVLTTDGSSA